MTMACSFDEDVHHSDTLFFLSALSATNTVQLDASPSYIAVDNRVETAEILKRVYT